MPPYRSPLPEELLEEAKEQGFEASVLVPSAVGVPVDTEASDEESERQTQDLFEKSERLADEELAAP